MKVSLKVLTGWFWLSPVLCLSILQSVGSNLLVQAAYCCQLILTSVKLSRAWTPVRGWASNLIFANRFFEWVMCCKGEVRFGASFPETVSFSLSPQVHSSEGQLGHWSLCFLDLNFAEPEARRLRGISTLQLLSHRAQVCWPMGHGISFCFLCGLGEQ